MTQNEKEKIDELQRQGLKYPAIAKLTGINVNAVKAHCRRHPVEVNSQPTTETFCKGCGKQITQTEKKRARQFCSDSCRMKWWNSHRDQVNHKKREKCVQCGAWFTKKEAGQKFCCRKCYDDYRRVVSK